MNTNPLQSRRLPSFRDHEDIQKILVPFSKTRILNKKTYVPNLDVSRKTATPKIKEESGSGENSKKFDGPNQRRERKTNIIQTESIFSSGIDKNCNSSSSKFGNRSSSVSGNTTSKKQLKRVVEKLDVQRKNKSTPPSFKEVFNKRPEQFEKYSALSLHDLPAALPSVKLLKYDSIERKEDFKINSLLTDILKPSDEESPLFILKTPKYVPAILDDSENPKMNIKQNDLQTNGYKCTIHDLPEGQIGKLQILKSGKLRLVLGDCKFWLQRGVNVNFREELAVVKVEDDKKLGEIVNLGVVKDRIVVVPDNVTELITAT